MTEADVARFGELTADYARIHLDHALGRTLPGGRGFAHGLLGAAWALGALTRWAPDRVGRDDPTAHVRAFEVRFAAPIFFGDTLSFEWDEADGHTSFEARADDGRVTTRGRLEVECGEAEAAAAPAPAPAIPPEPAPASGWTAEDVLAHGPRGTERIRTLTEADVLEYVRFTGELNPLYLDAPFAEASARKGRIVPPMLCFCLAFSTWLDGLMGLPLAGDERSAGHLGDRWRVVAPARVGDTLSVRFAPSRLRRTRSRPDQGVLTFGLELLAEGERRLQTAEVDIMLPMRPIEPENTPSA